MDYLIADLVHNFMSQFTTVNKIISLNYNLSFKKVKEKRKLSRT